MLDLGFRLWQIGVDETIQGPWRNMSCERNPEGTSRLAVTPGPSSVRVAAEPRDMIFSFSRQKWYGIGGTVSMEASA